MEMASERSSKVCVVTGATSGIGRAAAIGFAREGAKVVIAGRRRLQGEEVVRIARREGGDATYHKTDVSRESEVQDLFDAAIRTYGRVDSVFINAGVSGRFATLDQTTAEEFDALVATNLRGAWFCLRAASTQMRQQGSGGAIVINSSWLAVGGSSGSSAYSATKGALDAMARAAAVELAEHGIRVNSIQPGYIVTEMFRGFLDPEDRVAGAPFLHATPARRYGTEEEAAALAVWLCSDAASYVTGQSIAVDGGLTVPGHRPGLMSFGKV